MWAPKDEALGTQLNYLQLPNEVQRSFYFNLVANSISQLPRAGGRAHAELLGCGRPLHSHTCVPQVVQHHCSPPHLDRCPLSLNLIVVGLMVAMVGHYFNLQKPCSSLKVV
jgi:hypothetical protein